MPGFSLIVLALWGEKNVKGMLKKKMQRDRQTDLVLRLRAAGAGSRGSREENPVPDPCYLFPRVFSRNNLRIRLVSSALGER